MVKATTVRQVAQEDPLARAQAEVARLNARELELAGSYQQVAAQLAGVRAARGDQVLASSDAAGAARESGRQVAELVEALDGIADAAGRARELRLAAIPAVYRAVAEKKEHEADQLEAEAARLQGESDDLRRALEAHDDCSYVPVPPELPERTIGAQRGGALTIIQVRVPRFERLRLEARSKRGEAGQDRVKAPHRAGMVEADDLEQLLTAVYVDPMRVGPTVDQIRTWSEQAIAKERRRRGDVPSTADGFVAVEAPMKLHLEWRNGAVDPAQSRILSTPAYAGGEQPLDRA